MNQLLNSFGKSLVRYRFVYLFTVSVLICLAIWAIFDRLEKETPVDFTPQAIFMDEGEKMNRLKTIEKTFGREDNDLIFILHGEGTNSIEGMKVIQEIHETLENHPLIEQLDSLYNAQYMEDIGQGLDPVPEDVWVHEDPHKTLENAQKEPNLQKMLVSDDKKTTVIRVRLD